MVKILLSGCNGHMGKVITAVVAEREDCTIVAGVDLVTASTADYPVYDAPSKVLEQPNVIIDFSHPSVLTSLLTYAKERKIPVILCTTGYTNEQVEELHTAAKEIPVFYSRNMSLGINLLIALAQKAAQVLGDGYDIEIIEKHHNQKLDAPSGTALMIADGICDALGEEREYVYDRHAHRKKRTKGEIGLHAVRGGTIVGEHEVLFAGKQEVVTIAHSAQSKDLFAVGAVNAAVFMATKKAAKAGLYDMNDMISDRQ